MSVGVRPFLEQIRFEGRERGAVLVESAIVSVLLLVIIAGALEYGTLFASTIDTSSGVRSAARVGSIVTPTDGPANDWNILQSLVVKSGVRRSNIERVVIFEANSNRSDPPQGCKAGAPRSGEMCNVYNPNDLLLDRTQLASLNSQRRWPESEREPGVDNIGVWVQMKNPKVFNDLIPAPSRYSDSFAMPITPIRDWSFSSNTNLGSEDPGPWTDDWLCHHGECIGIMSADGGGDSGEGGSSQWSANGAITAL